MLIQTLDPDCELTYHVTHVTEESLHVRVQSRLVSRIASS